MKEDFCRKLEDERKRNFEDKVPLEGKVCWVSLSRQRRQKINDSCRRTVSGNLDHNVSAGFVAGTKYGRIRGKAEVPLMLPEFMADKVCGSTI